MYKNLSGETDASVEAQIRKCNGGGSERNAVHKNYTETALGINMKMIWVEGGSFMMGCTSDKNNCPPDATNVRNVTVDGFYIGMLEVTQSQWEKVVGTSVEQLYNECLNKDNTLKMSGRGNEFPMYYVDYSDVLKFCSNLSKKTGKKYMLPTEAQWEYAARGGNKPDRTNYPGSNVAEDVAWYKKNSGGITHICGTKLPNSLGIYDMCGNVLEWCSDWYSEHYLNYDTYNPTGPSSGEYRCVRGGSWGTLSSFVNDRGRASVGMRCNLLGFRVVCIP